jgi:hypothetical protein
MSTDLERFNPASWHLGGVLRSTSAPQKPQNLRKRARNKAALAASFVLLSTAWAIPDSLTFGLDATSASRLPGEIVAVDTDSEPSADRIDPSEWGRLISLFRSLPRDERRDPDDPEPLI